MAFLLLNVFILVLVSTAAVLAYAQVLQLRRADEWLATPSVDYAALHAQWERERRERELARWRELRAAGAKTTGGEHARAADAGTA